MFACSICNAAKRSHPLIICEHLIVAALPKSKKVAVSKVEKPQTSNFRPLDPKHLEYFAKRGISKETLERNQVAQEHTWMPGQSGSAGPAIAFPYTRNGEVVNVKYRTMNKCFRQVKGAEKILYGLDDVVGQDTIIIVEGEKTPPAPSPWLAVPFLSDRMLQVSH